MGLKHQHRAPSYVAQQTDGAMLNPNEPGAFVLDDAQHVLSAQCRDLVDLRQVLKELLLQNYVQVIHERILRSSYMQNGNRPMFSPIQTIAVS